MTTAPIAIMGALDEELAAVLALLEHAEVQHHAGREFHLGRLDGRPVVLVRARIGKVAAALTCAVLAERFKARALVFTGVAGALSPAVDVGDVVVADTLLQHDMDASPLFPRFEVPLSGRSHFAADAVISDALATAAATRLPELDRLHGRPRAARVHRGLIVSGDVFVADAARRAALCAALPDALAVEMEGAAVAQVCHDLDLPFAVVRTISDRADASAPGDFGAFLTEVAAPCAATLVLHGLRALAAQDAAA